MYKVNAMGLSCPEPILLLKKAIKDNNEIILSVDNKTSVETCTRFAESKGFKVDVKSTDGMHELTIKK